MVRPAGNYDIFIDESGDLGFGNKSSKTFVVAYVVTDNPYVTRNLISRLKRSMNQKQKSSIPEFKLSRDSYDTRMRVLGEIRNCEFDLGYVVIDKSYVKDSLRADPPRLYRFLVVNYVITNLVNAYDISSLRFTVDKSLGKKDRDNFNRYLVDKLSWRQVVERGESMPSIDIVHAASEGEPCLQVADYCSGAAYLYFERSDATYYDLIKAKTRFKSAWGNIDW